MRTQTNIMAVKDGAPFYRNVNSKTPYYVDTKTKVKGKVLASNVLNDTYSFPKAAIVWVGNTSDTAQRSVVSDLLLPGLLNAIKGLAEKELQKITDKDKIALLKDAAKVIATIKSKKKGVQAGLKFITEVLNEF